MKLVEEIIFKMSETERVTSEVVDAIGLTLPAIDIIVEECSIPGELDSTDDIDVSELLTAPVLTIPGDIVKYKFIKYL